MKLRRTLTPERAQEIVNDQLGRFLQRFDLNTEEDLPKRIGLVAETRIGDSYYTLIRRPVAQVELLTERQREIALRVSAGQQNKEIAWDMGMSPFTVASHLREIFRKLNVDSRTAIALQIMTDKEIMSGVQVSD